jgi:hypothetical protein
MSMRKQHILPTGVNPRQGGFMPGRLVLGPSGVEVSE